MRSRVAITVQLVHISGPMKGTVQEFTDDTITIGRHPSCNVRFPHDLAVISRKHAEIVREGNQFKLTDHSTNGTLVNGKPVEETLLKSGDVMTFSDGGPQVSFLTEIKEVDGRVVEEALQVPDQIQQAPSFYEPPKAQQPPPRVEAQRPETTSPQRVNAPFTIQYGPTIRSFKALPITIGKNLKCEFVLNHPAILDLHAQFFFFQDGYWIKDLTGRNLVSVNHQPVNNQTSLRADDTIALSPSGPAFLFLGEGRLAETTEPEERPTGSVRKVEDEIRREQQTGGSRDGLFSRIKKVFKP
jgi:pSer/pThr/pTyr-binding forkhead associated (FHA) protein